MSRRGSVASEELLKNAAKTILANVRFAGVDNPIKSIVLTSAVPGEGKTTVTKYLAQAIATSGNRVLMVECDMRRRALANALGIHARYGLYAVLSQQVKLEDAVVPLWEGDAAFLDAEPQIPNPADLLSTKRFARLVAQLEDAYDYVLFDTPPVSAFIDSAIISSFADATLLVVRTGYTKRSAVRAAYAQLRKADANVIGTVLNFCKVARNEAYYSYYRRGNEARRGGAHGSGAGSGLTGVIPAGTPDASRTGKRFSQ